MPGSTGAAKEPLPAAAEASVDAAIDLAVRLKSKGHYEEAIAQYLKALKIAPKSARCAQQSGVAAGDVSHR